MRIDSEVRRMAIIQMAKDAHEKEGQVEIDDSAILSEANNREGDNGCYVQAWVWVDFEGTAHDKEKKSNG